MVKAYIFIVADAGAEKEVIGALQSIDEVEEADLVYGEYDVVAKVNIDNVAALSDFILENIRTIQGVRRTSTLIVAHE